MWISHHVGRTTEKNAAGKFVLPKFGKWLFCSRLAVGKPRQVQRCSSLTLFHVISGMFGQDLPSL